MAKNKKLTPNQDKYKELQKRLQRRVTDLKKRGYTPNRAFKEEWLSGEIPDEVRKYTLEKMKKALENIYEYVRYYDPLKETYISGTERRKQERQEAARKGWETRRENAMKIDVFWQEFDEEQSRIAEQVRELPSEQVLILNQVEELINAWEESPSWSERLKELKQEDKNKVKSIFDGAIDELGREQVARNIKGKSKQLLSYLNDALYASGNKYKISGRDGVNLRIQQIRDILYGRASTVQESMELTKIIERLNEGE